MEKPKLNLGLVLFLILGLLLIFFAGSKFFGTNSVNKTTPPVLSVPPTGISTNLTLFYGKIKTGSEVEEKKFCADGLYLVADADSFIVNETKTLMLKLPKNIDGTEMFSTQDLIGKKIEVLGKYPAQQIFCEALTCDCEDYIQVEDINLVTP